MLVLHLFLVPRMMCILTTLGGRTSSEAYRWETRELHEQNAGEEFRSVSMQIDCPKSGVCRCTDTSAAVAGILVHCPTEHGSNQIRKGDQKLRMLSEPEKAFLVLQGLGRFQKFHILRPCCSNFFAFCVPLNHTNICIIRHLPSAARVCCSFQSKITLQICTGKSR